MCQSVPFLSTGTLQPEPVDPTNDEPEVLQP
jgi:hypothetical protein